MDPVNLWMLLLDSGSVRSCVRSRADSSHTLAILGEYPDPWSALDDLPRLESVGVLVDATKRPGYGARWSLDDPAASPPWTALWWTPWRGDENPVIFSRWRSRCGELVGFQAPELSDWIQHLRTAGISIRGRVARESFAASLRGHLGSPLSMSDREREVLQQASEGRSLKEIGDELGIPVGAVQNCLSRMTKQAISQRSSPRAPVAKRLLVKLIPGSP